MVTSSAPPENQHDKNKTHGLKGEVEFSTNQMLDSAMYCWIDLGVEMLRVLVSAVCFMAKLCLAAALRPVTNLRAPWFTVSRDYRQCTGACIYNTTITVQGEKVAATNFFPCSKGET